MRPTYAVNSHYPHWIWNSHFKTPAYGSSHLWQLLYDVASPPGAFCAPDVRSQFDIILPLFFRLLMYSCIPYKHIAIMCMKWQVSTCSEKNNLHPSPVFVDPNSYLPRTESFDSTVGFWAPCRWTNLFDTDTKILISSVPAPDASCVLILPKSLFTFHSLRKQMHSYLWHSLVV